MAPIVSELAIKACHEQRFTILCDGGNDNFEKRYFGIVVQLWDNQLDKVATRFLDALVANIATGETLFQALDSVLQTCAIPWIDVIGFASNTVSIMVKKRNSVLS